jgi:hypothetical protein
VKGHAIVRLIHILRVKEHFSPVLAVQDNLAEEGQDINELARNLPTMLVGTRRGMVARTDTNHPCPLR